MLNDRPSSSFPGCIKSHHIMLVFCGNVSMYPTVVIVIGCTLDLSKIKPSLNYNIYSSIRRSPVHHIDSIPPNIVSKKELYMLYKVKLHGLNQLTRSKYMV